MELRAPTKTEIKNIEGIRRSVVANTNLLGWFNSTDERSNM